MESVSLQAKLRTPKLSKTFRCHQIELAQTNTASKPTKISIPWIAPVPNMQKTKMLWWQERCLSIWPAYLKQRVWSQTAYQLCMSLGLNRRLNPKWLVVWVARTHKNFTALLSVEHKRPSCRRRHLCKNVDKLGSVYMAGTSQTYWMWNLKETIQKKSKNNHLITKQGGVKNVYTFYACIFGKTYSNNNFTFVR